MTSTLAAGYDIPGSVHPEGVRAALPDGKHLIQIRRRYRQEVIVPAWSLADNRDHRDGWQGDARGQQ